MSTLISILIGLVFAVIFAHARCIFKIAYYEAKLTACRVDFSHVRNMAWYKLWINY